MTGKFRVLAPRAVAGANATTFSGRFVYNITISILSALPATAPVECSVSANVFDASGSISESASVPAIRHGATATCTATIPYSWPLAAPAADAVSLGYSVFSSSLPLSRESFISLPAIRVPGNGATTTENIKTVL